MIILELGIELVNYTGAILRSVYPSMLIMKCISPLRMFQSLWKPVSSSMVCMVILNNSTFLQVMCW